MSLKKWALPVAVLVLMFMLYREFMKHAEEVDNAPVAPHKVVKKPEAPVRPQVTPASAPAAKSQPTLGKAVATEKTADGSRPKPPKGSIPFEVYDGLVVAYGDILLGKPTREDFPERGFIEAPPPHAWPKNEIAYSFEPNFPNPDRVNRVLNYFNEYTTIRFVPYNGSQPDSIVFARTSVPLCLSYVGRISGHQPIYLDDHRCREREIMHELMHALGFIHEQSRPDRDSFVRINWDRIQEDKQSQFEVAPPVYSDMYKGRPFDYQSVMIYGPTDFAKRTGDTTMESLTGVEIQPSPQGLSPEDLQRLFGLYAR